MSLYDDVDLKAKTTTENVTGWSSGIKLLQSQLQLKKATVTQTRREQQRKSTSLAPVINLNAKSKDGCTNETTTASIFQVPLLLTDYKSKLGIKQSTQKSYAYGEEFDWNVPDEYDPMRPNEFHRIVKEMRFRRESENDKADNSKHRDRKRKSRFSDKDDLVSSPSHTHEPSGFTGIHHDDDDDARERSKYRNMTGAAIAPPPSLQECSDNSTDGRFQKSSGFGSVAAKIMARYGFKEGQGLGKQEQGMSSALQVEKTSKRGGRIIHEKDMPLVVPLVNYGPSITPPPAPLSPTMETETSITEIIKNPTKVVLLKNMVGPGEVDDDLEPEVKDECHTKYGEVASVIIHEIVHEDAEEVVRIFVEFGRIESALKAVVDLNGRFFGGRQVKASFYDPDKFDNLQLDE